MDFPGTVPVPGGTDAGMDGAVPDGEDIAYPVITTTATDVSGNLRRNLSRYIRMGGRRKVILVTSQKLSPRRRHNLEVQASALDFDLVQIYEREAVAFRLYSNPHW